MRAKNLVGRERRRRWSVDDKLQIVSEAFAPGTWVALVARRRDVSRSRIGHWPAALREARKLNAEMARLGWALAYRPGNDPLRRPEYEPQEAEAGAAGRGMWRGTFIPPWEWRHR